MFIDYILTIAKFAVILLSLTVIIRCIRSMLSERYEPEVWAYLRVDNQDIPITHWENLVGRASSSDIRIKHRSIGRVHAVLTRDDNGYWTIYEIFAQGGVWVNGMKAGEIGVRVFHGDVINLGGVCVRFLNLSPAQQQELEDSRTAVGKRISPLLTLLELSVLQLFLLVQHAFSAKEEYLFAISLGFLLLIVLEWSLYGIMRIMNRSGFEVETIAFYLTSLGMSVAASSTPDDIFKQILLIIVSVILFIINGLWLRNLKRTATMRVPIAALALLLLAVNVVASEAVFGARNWLEIGGFSFQPSELVKVAFIYFGASTLDSLYRKKNLFSFIVFSAICVIALALIGDFGTALIFFVSFLVLSFMRSGSIATVFLAISGAVLAGFLAISVKPYIAQRFASWGHVWEDVYDKGFQQTRAMSAAASGGLFGVGAGEGWLHSVFAANTDMVFAMVCEELGLIIGLCMVLAILVLAFFAMRSARNGRSSFYAIAACATTSMLLVQLALNVFGSLDILPFTGVTFPFVSRGGSSLMSCWMMMAFLKGTDTRRNASFAVRPDKNLKLDPDEDYEFETAQEDHLYFADDDDEDDDDPGIWRRL